MRNAQRIVRGWAKIGLGVRVAGSLNVWVRLCSGLPLTLYPKHIFGLEVPCAPK